MAKVYSIGVDPAFGFNRVLVELSVPSLPALAAQVEFGEHVYSKAGRQSTEQVIACATGVIAVSEDLGETWEAFEPAGTGAVRLRNSFTTSGGLHLIQGAAPPAREPVSGPDVAAPVFVFDRDWALLDRVQPAESPWHGARSVDEAGGVIMYGEYPDNAAKYGQSDEEAEHAARERTLLPARVVRSRDGGLAWETVLELSWRDVRHFHTVVADPFQPGRWWASTGDRPRECQVWESTDDGDTWIDVTPSEVEIDLHPSWARYGQSAFRFTDLVVRRDDLLWGTDDWLGSLANVADPAVAVARRVGSRMMRSQRETPWRPEPLGYVGNPVRSIVDLGAAFLVLTEAKHPEIGVCPQVLLMSAADPSLIRPLFTVDNYAARGTGLSYSKASQAARDGVFFSYRQSRDAFDGGPRILKWRVAFD